MILVGNATRNYYLLETTTQKPFLSTGIVVTLERNVLLRLR